MLQIINKTTKNFKETPGVEQLIAERYNQKIEDVQQWLSLTQWSQKQLSALELKKVQDKLLQLELIKNRLLEENILFNL
jgi:hypothetical protein